MNTSQSPPIAAESRDLIEITDPRDGSFVGDLAVVDTEELRGLVNDARAAFPGWRLTPAAERGERLRRAADLIEQHAEELAKLEQRENGRRLTDALGGIGAAVGTLRQYAELAPLHRGKSLNGALSAVDMMRAEPRGVAAVITPWNDPVAVSAGLIGAALATGNVVVSKPSERCPHLGARLGELLAECFPSNVFTSVTGGRETGEYLVSMTEIDIVAHVGSTLAGERIARAVALTGAHLLRENGGNDALVIDAGVDPAWAASQAAIGAFTGNGQICTSVERIFVHHEVAEPFLSALRDEASRWNADPDRAPLVDERMRAEVHRQVSESVEQGAVVLLGGEVPEGPGAYYPATVLTDCAPHMTVFTNETFGPVAPVMVVDSFESGVALAADDDHGLAATVLTTSMERAQWAMHELPVGTVKVNHVFGGAPGGAAEPRRRSGSGFGFGPELLDEMTTTKVIHISPGVPSTSA